MFTGVILYKLNIRNMVASNTMDGDDTSKLILRHCWTILEISRMSIED